MPQSTILQPAPIVEDMTLSRDASLPDAPTVGSGQTKQLQMRVIESTVRASSQMLPRTTPGYLAPIMPPISNTIGTLGISIEGIHFRARQERSFARQRRDHWFSAYIVGVSKSG
jgi:hypothetical protein